MKPRRPAWMDDPETERERAAEERAWIHTEWEYERDRAARGEAFEDDWGKEEAA